MTVPGFGRRGKWFGFNEVWGRFAVGDFAADAAQLVFGALGLAVELASAGLNGEEEGVGGGEVVGGAGLVAMGGNGLVEQAGFEGEELDDPLGEDDVVDEAGALGGVFDLGGAAGDDIVDAVLPGWGELMGFGVEVVFAGVAAGAGLAIGRGRTAGAAGVGAVGGELLFGDADEGHGLAYSRVRPAVRGTARRRER
ncbi:MAG TPA: hypothetical protein VGK29_02255 [Paludibaculum sp.]